MANKKSLKEYIAWQKSPEIRSWKRKVQLIEIAFFALSVTACLISLALYEGPKKYEAVFYVFGGCLLVSSIMLSRFMLENVFVARYVRWCILLGLGSGVGLLAISIFTTLVSAKNAV